MNWPKPKTRRLTRLKLHEVSLVPAPANIGAVVLMHKSSPPDSFAKAEADVRNYKPDIAIGAALELAKAGVPMNRAFFQDALETVGKQVLPGFPPSTQLNAAIRTDAGGVLLKALQHAPWR